MLPETPSEDYGAAIFDRPPYAPEMGQGLYQTGQDYPTSELPRISAQIPPENQTGTIYQPEPQKGIVLHPVTKQPHEALRYADGRIQVSPTPLADKSKHFEVHAGFNEGGIFINGFGGEQATGHVLNAVNALSATLSGQQQLPPRHPQTISVPGNPRQEPPRTQQPGPAAPTQPPAKYPVDFVAPSPRECTPRKLPSRHALVSGAMIIASLVAADGIYGKLSDHHSLIDFSHPTNPLHAPVNDIKEIAHVVSFGKI